MSNTIDDLRQLLFETIRSVKDGSMDVDRARAVEGLAKSITDTAKVEVDFARVTGAELHSNFLPPPPAPDRSEVRTMPMPVRSAPVGKF